MSKAALNSKAAAAAGPMYSTRSNPSTSGRAASSSASPTTATSSSSSSTTSLPAIPSPSPVFPASADLRLSLKASLLAHLFQQIKHSQRLHASQLHQLVHARPSDSPSPSPSPALPYPSAFPPPSSPVDHALTQLLFLQQYFCCLSAHLRSLHRRHPSDASLPPEALLKAQGERDAYFHLIADVLGLVTAAPALPSADAFITVPLSIVVPSPAIPASRPSTSPADAPRPSSSSHSLHPTHHTRFRSSPTLPSAHSTGVHALTAGSARNTIQTPSNVTFTQGRWTSLTPSDASSADSTVDELNAIDDWDEADSKDAVQRPRAPVPAKPLTPAYRVELGDVHDEQLDVDKLNALKAQQRQEQERALKDVRMVDGRWQSVSQAAPDELDDIPDFEEGSAVGAATTGKAAPSSTVSSSSTPRSSMAGDDLQGALDAMSDDGDSRMGSQASSGASSVSPASRVHSRQPSAGPQRRAPERAVVGKAGAGEEKEKERDALVNLETSTIGDEDVQYVEDVSETVDAATTNRAQLISLDEIDDISDFQHSTDDRPLALPSPSSAVVAAHPSATTDRAARELNEFVLTGEWRSARLREEAEWAALSVGKGVEVAEVSWGELLRFAESWTERDGSEMDDVCERDDSHDEEDEGEVEGEEEEEDEDEEDEEESELGEGDDGGESALSKKLAKHSAALEAEDLDDADWGDDG